MRALAARFVRAWWSVSRSRARECIIGAATIVNKQRGFLDDSPDCSVRSSREEGNRDCSESSSVRFEGKRTDSRIHRNLVSGINVDRIRLRSTTGRVQQARRRSRTPWIGGCEDGLSTPTRYGSSSRQRLLAVFSVSTRTFVLYITFYFSVPLTPLPFAVRQKDSSHANPMAWGTDLWHAITLCSKYLLLRRVVLVVEYTCRTTRSPFSIPFPWKDCGVRVTKKRETPLWHSYPRNRSLAPSFLITFCKLHFPFMQARN